jgi:hypothetical protein
LDVSRSGPYLSSEMAVKVHEEVTGIKSYKKFSKDRDSVSKAPKLDLSQTPLSC